MSMIGKTLGNFECTALLGKGGMGEVYRAKDQKLGRDVAIKVLPEEFAKDADRVARFQREAKLLASLNHPNIAAIHGLEEAEGIHFLVMELIEGQTLADRIKAGPVPDREALKLALQIAEALEAAHEKGVIHRDLKPANVMITSRGHTKVMDFGLAKKSSLPGGIDSQNETLSEITLAGAIIGTPNYMSPEQLRGHPADVRSDLYAFGLVYYEMLTGFHPFKQLPSSETPSAIFADTLKPGLKPKQRIPKQIRNILSKLLVKDPAQRYQSAQELHLALSEISRDERTGIERLRFLRPIWILGSLIVSALAITAMIWWLQDDHFLSPQTALAFQERDWILIASFQNQTDEAIFNNSLITPFTIGLEQSSYANVYPESRVVEVLKRMKKTETQNINASIAQEIALREGIKALIIPSIIGIGDNYRLTASIRDPISSIDVMVESEEAKGKEKILDALDRLTRKIRNDLGESMEVITQTSKPLARATTSSIKALSLYTEAARKVNLEAKNKEAEVLVKEALEVDPHFTYAKAALGMLQYTKLRKQQEGVKLLTEAARNVEDLTENEKLMVLAWHAAYVEQDLKNAARYEKALVTLHPDLSSPHNNLGLSYMQLGRYEEAIAEFKEAVRLDPNFLVANQNLAVIYLNRLGYLNSAVEISKNMIALNPRSLWAHNYLGWAYLGMDDFNRAQAAFVEELQRQPNNTLILWRLADVHRLQGHYQDAIALLERILEIDPSDQEANYNLGIIYRHLGETEMALKHFEIFRRYTEKKIREDPADGRGYIDLALTFAQLGEKDRSVSLGQKAMAMPPCNATEPFVGKINRAGNLINLCDFEYAKLLSVQGRNQEALDSLELAVRRGYRNYIYMKIDPDLQNLHNEPRFRELTKEVLHQK